MNRVQRHSTKRRVLLAVFGLVTIGFAFLFRAWKATSNRGGQKYAEPFRIAGNFYYVGANDVASFLITGPEGHVLIDGGYPGTPPMIMARIRKLGFDIRDVNEPGRVIPVSESFPRRASRVRQTFRLPAALPRGEPGPRPVHAPHR